MSVGVITFFFCRERACRCVKARAALLLRKMDAGLQRRIDVNLMRECRADEMFY